MSSDAGELELRVVGGGDTATPNRTSRAATRTTTARQQQDETYDERFKQECHHDDETPNKQQCHPSAIRQEETHKALILKLDRLRKEEAGHCGDSNVQTQKPIGASFTSRLFLRLSINPGLDKPELRLKKNSDPCLHSLTETQRTETENSSCQVNGQTTTKDLSITHSFSNREFGPHECNGLHILPCGPQPRTGTRSVELEEDIKDHTKLGKHTDLVELSNPTGTMLSSTVVTVLAPHWSSRLRRPKRPEGNGNSESQGNLQDVANRAHERFQETVDRSLIDGSQAQLKVPFLVSSLTNIHASSYTGSSSQTPKFTNTANATPLGFERSYASVHRPFRPKTVSSLISTGNASSKTNYSPVSTASTSSSFLPGIHPAATTAPSPSFLSPPVTPAIAYCPTPVTVSSPLTPPATPIITSPNYSDSSSPNEGSSTSPDSDPKKLHPHVEGKRVRRVTWEDSVDLKQSEPVTVEKPEPSKVPTSPVTSSSSLQSVKVPSIFSFLRSSSPNTYPLCSPSPKTSSIQVVKGGKYRSLSSDSVDLASRDRETSKQRPSDTLIFDQGRQDLFTSRQERTLSVESSTVQCHSSPPLSLPPDFSSGYKLRYSSPPYSTLMSTRSTQGETKTIIPRSPLFQRSQSDYTPRLSIRTDPVATMALPMSKPPLSPISLPQPLSLPFQNKTATQGSTKCGVSETDQINNNHSKNSQDRQNSQILLVDNRLHKAHTSSSTCVTETLVYSIKSKVDTAAPRNTTPKPLQHTANTPVSVETNLSQQSHRVQSKDATREPHSHSDQSSSGSSSAESQPHGERSNRRMKETVLGKSRFFSVEGNNEQSPRRSRFALKKSVSTPNSSLSRSESDRTSKTYNKMDQVFNRLRQTFSTRWSNDDIFRKRALQTSSVSRSSDVRDIPVESSKMLEQKEQEKGMVLSDNKRGTEGTNRWTQNRHALIPPSAAGSPMAGDELYTWSDKSTPETEKDEQKACAEHMKSQDQTHLIIHSPTTHQFDFYKDNGTVYIPKKQFLSCRDPSSGSSPNLSADYPTPFKKSTSSPRSPFSPFSSLSPVSPFTSPDVTDDSVFYSPKLLRRGESPSPREPGEGLSLGGSRRRRASTGPPSAGQGQEKECLASSYADLKYGIEPGRSFSVSSVLSSRPSGPGRISTGSRFMSVGDLTESASTCGGTGRDLDQWSVTPDWTTECDYQPSKDCRMSYFLNDPGKMRSRSLPRSLTRRLANWSSEVSASPPVTTTTSRAARLRSPNMNTCHFAWNTEGPPTPPPTPPLSPVSRRMSKPSSPSSPTFPSSSGAPQPLDSQSSRGHLPSRGYKSSLSTFDESSDSSSDTTTDDEYYLETGEDKEKETEL
ncbi:hypothetical protein PFLUV_G00254160 [Perca fluviatilis]|uniref:Uncharacterized protein n=1 Tax=Perca fluviatilis TaxID=8168 RepID=A0A6A5E396_PERFL|nr:hypothetical protein PFLUV_G00254160 [Perca fluviatilis]